MRPFSAPHSRAGSRSGSYGHGGATRSVLARVHPPACAGRGKTIHHVAVSVQIYMALVLQTCSLRLARGRCGAQSGFVYLVPARSYPGRQAVNTPAGQPRSLARMDFARPAPRADWRNVRVRLPAGNGSAAHRRNRAITHWQPRSSMDAALNYCTKVFLGVVSRYAMVLLASRTRLAACSSHTMTLGEFEALTIIFGIEQCTAA